MAEAEHRACRPCFRARPGWRHKTGTGARNYNDAGIIFQGDRPLCVLTAYTENVPVDLDEGTPGHTAAAQLIGTLGRLCYDALKS